MFSTVIPAIARALSTSCTEYCDEYSLRLPQSIGAGYIRGIDFDSGLGIAEWNVRCNSHGEMTFNSETPPLLMIFSIEGDLTVSIDQGTKEHLSPLQGVMVAVRQGSSVKLEWEPDTQTRFNVMILMRRQLLDEIDCYLHSAPERLTEVFRDVEGQEQFFYRSDYTIAVAEAIHAVNRGNLTGVSSTLYLKAKAWEILALMIRQYLDGADGTDRSYRSSLKKRDIEALQQARHHLIADLQNPPTIEELAREVGLNRNKLQSGFKAIYGATINRYLRDVRLRQAKMLLTEDHESIADVAEEIGYSNSSQFSRRFRERYGLLPSQYVSMIRRHRGVELDGHDPHQEDIDREMTEMEKKERSSSDPDSWKK